MSSNEANWDRILRTVAGVVLLVLVFLNSFPAPAAILFIILGVILLVTGAFGYCPTYRFLNGLRRRS